MAALPLIDASRLRGDAGGASLAALADALRGVGACRIAGWPEAALAGALRDDLAALRDASALAPAAVGRTDGRAHRADMRGDSTCWLDDPRCGDAARAFLGGLDDLRRALNRSAFLGLSDVEAHYAVYPPGTHYMRHRDRFRDDDARVVSWVTYLNADWRDADGGALRLHLPEGTVDVTPTGGSVCFLSQLEHEVLPTRRERISIAAWFRR